MKAKLKAGDSEDESDDEEIPDKNVDSGDEQEQASGGFSFYNPFSSI